VAVGGSLEDRRATRASVADLELQLKHHNRYAPTSSPNLTSAHSLHPVHPYTHPSFVPPHASHSLTHKSRLCLPRLLPCGAPSLPPPSCLLPSFHPPSSCFLLTSLPLAHNSPLYLPRLHLNSSGPIPRNASNSSSTHSLHQLQHQNDLDNIGDDLASRLGRAQQILPATTSDTF
jgi:hypothetical protein